MTRSSRPATDCRPTQRRGQEGFALVVVLLSTIVIAALIISTLSITTMGARTGTARDAQSMQALLAAETGVNTFISRVKEAGFKGTVGQIDCFVNGSRSTGNNSTSPCAATTFPTEFLLTGETAGPRFTVRILQTDMNKSNVVVQSVGKYGNAARATVTQQVNVIKPPFLNMAAPGALTSCPSITGGGGATLAGMDATSTGLVSNFTTVTTVSAGTPPNITVPMSVADILTNGSYFQLNGKTYKISSIEGENVFKIAGVGHNDYAIGTNPVMSLIPMAARGGATLAPPTTPASATTLYRLPISDPTGVFIDDVVYFRSGSPAVTYALTVKKKDFETPGDLTTGYIDVELGALSTAAGAYIYNNDTGARLQPPVPAPTPGQVTSMLEGTPIWRYVSGGTSANQIRRSNGTYADDPTDAVSKDYWGGNSNVTPAGIAGNPAVKCGDELFKQVFNGVTKSTYYDLVPTANRLTSISKTKPLSRDIYWLGPAAGQSPGNFSVGSDDLCGSGILVINGTLDMGGTGSLNSSTKTCTSQGSPDQPKGFSGLIYVIGNLSNQGNSTINGAVVAEGSVTNVLNTTLNGGMNITYDPKAMLASSRSLSPVSFSMRKNSWGQQ